MPIVVITGPPCAGKSTHVDEHREPADLVLDLDRLAHALGYPEDHVPIDSAHPAALAARAARSVLIKAALDQAPRTRHTTWLIDARPASWQLHNYTRAGARIVHLDPGPVECERRAVAAGRPTSTLDQIRDWFATAMPVDASALFENAATTQTDSAGSPPRAPRKTGEAR